MPLSDDEARLLQQLEQSLAAEDPDFASTLRGSKFLEHTRRVATLAVVGFLIGLVVLFAGAVYAMTWLGAIGFLAMLGSAYAFTVAWRRGRAVREPGDAGPPPRTGGSAKARGSFVDRMEERWQRRQDDSGF